MYLKSNYLSPSRIVLAEGKLSEVYRYCRNWKVYEDLDRSGDNKRFWDDGIKENLQEILLLRQPASVKMQVLEGTVVISDNDDTENSDKNAPENSDNAEAEKIENAEPEKIENAEPENIDEDEPENIDADEPENIDEHEPEDSDKENCPKDETESSDKENSDK